MTVYFYESMKWQLYLPYSVVDTTEETLVLAGDGKDDDKKFQEFVLISKIHM